MYIYVCVYVCVYIYMCVYIYIYIYMYAVHVRTPLSMCFAVKRQNFHGIALSLEN